VYGTATASEFRIIDVATTGNLTLRHMTLRNGCADGSFASAGGAIANLGALTLEHVALVGNHAETYGGAVFSYGDFSADYCTFANNSAGEGGAIANSYDPHSIVVDHSLFFGNSATGADGGSGLGGGIFHYVGTTTVRNTTFSQNSAHYGGAIWLRVDPMALSNVTIADNSATLGPGGISDFAAGTNVLRIKNSILNNNSGGNCGLQPGELQALGANLSSDATCSGFSKPSMNPKLGPLAANGGETRTYALLPGSVAFNAASDCLDAAGNVLVDDQRGASRPFGGICDLGAYERDESIFADGFDITFY